MMADYAPRFWFYGPAHLACDAVSHILSDEQAPCHCGAYTWQAADQYLYDARPPSLVARALTWLLGEPCPHCGHRLHYHEPHCIRVPCGCPGAR
jgi:hypothetical protein